MALTEAIKFQNLIPGVYTSESRDFQILCRACDVLFNGTKYDIDNIIEILDTSEIRNTLLPLLKTKLGFYSNVHLTDFELRLILQAIPYIVKCKGSRKAIFYAVNTYAKVHKLTSPITIVIHNKTTVDGGWVYPASHEFLPVDDEPVIIHRVDEDEEPSEPISVPEPYMYQYYVNEYSIKIGLKTSFEDLYILNELLKYAVPCGYNLQYYYYDDIIHKDTGVYIDWATYKSRVKHITSPDQIGRFSTNGEVLLFTPPATEQPFDFAVNNSEMEYSEHEPFALADEYEMYVDDEGNLIYQYEMPEPVTPPDEDEDEEA